jgi:hypothetical protein
MSVETLVEEFQKLSNLDRVRFFELLEVDESFNDLDPEWLQEIQARWAKFESGESIALDGEEVEQKLAAKWHIC